jgi:cytochrome P450
MYWLLLDKNAYQKLRTECRRIFAPGEDFDAAKLGDWKRAPYLNACVNEAVRLLPSGPNGMQRVVITPGGLMAPNGMHIPEGTKVSVPIWTVHHDARNFEKPWDFIPERWIEGSGFEGTHNPTAFMPFSLGAYSCIGKPLALLQIRLFLYRYVRLSRLYPSPEM